MMRRLCAGALCGAFAAFVFEARAQEPVPQQAFVAPSAPVAIAEPAPVAEAVAEPVAAQGAAPDGWLTTAEKPSPIYMRWLESLFDLVAPGEPYRRDKLVLSLGMSLGYDTNVFYSAINPIASAVTGVNASADYHFGSRRVQLDANLSGGVNYYQNRPGGSNDDNFALTLALGYQLMPRLKLSFTTNTSYLSQPEPQLIGGIFQYGGSYFYTDTRLDLNYQMRPRFGLALGYDYNALKYDDEVINQGSGFYQQTFSLSGNFLVSPRTTLTLQYRYNPVSYYESGIGSTGQFLLVGIEQTLSPRLKYTFMFGSEYRSLENPAPDSPSSYLGPFAEGSLNYNFAPRSLLTGSMRLGTEPSGTSGVTIRQTFRSSLGVTHYIGGRLSVNGSIAFEHDLYDQPGIDDFSQDIYSTSVSLSYQLAYYTSIVLRDDYIVVEGSTPNSSYSRNFSSIGLQITF
ncbi:MAG: outer membrane beta-barrel protein [Chthoniobacterales bacterium]